MSKSLRRSTRVVREPRRFVDEEFVEEKDLGDDEYASDVESDPEYELLKAEQCANESDDAFVTEDDLGTIGTDTEDNKLQDFDSDVSDVIKNEIELEDADEDSVLKAMAEENAHMDQLEAELPDPKE